MLKFDQQALQSSPAAQIARKLLSDAKFYSGYSRWNETTHSYESWQEAVSRVMSMHRQYYADKIEERPELVSLMLKAEAAYADKSVLGAQRALQFGGEQLLKHQARLYNCSSTYIDRPAAFNEAMYLLLCGCGVGFSVQHRHLRKLPKIQQINQNDIVRFVIPDSIEGWADAFAVLLSAYFEKDAVFPEYKGKQIHFDYSKIRPRGAPISGGFKAPGPDGLELALQRCEALLQRELSTTDSCEMRSIVAYDFIMHMSDAVLSGGVRRSATICLFDKTDKDMLEAKTGLWWKDNPQRGRSNNSVVLLRDELGRGEWADIMKCVRQFGEPGFVFVEDLDFAFNPCVEIGMRPQTIHGVSGFQFCNLTEINGGKCSSKEAFFKACEAAAILGTLQAGYTKFKYVSQATREITEREALIGVSITGWMDNPHILFDEEVLKEGARIVRETNKKVAQLLGINVAARTTCAKPSGNASVLLATASGIHPCHAKLYLRYVQMLDNDDVAQLLRAVNPNMVEVREGSVTGADLAIAFPMVALPNAKTRHDFTDVELLNYVKKAQQFWVEEGTNVELCVHPKLRHNISNTISVTDWDRVEQYLYDNRYWFAGVSLLGSYGSMAYAQAPFTEVRTAEELVESYGEAAMFASGLIVDGLHAFANKFWQAAGLVSDVYCAVLNEDYEKSTELLTNLDVQQKDWVLRVLKFCKNFCNNDMEKTLNCLKECYILHRWCTIVRTLQDVDFVAGIRNQKMIEADSLGAQSCAGGACEVNF